MILYAYLVAAAALIPISDTLFFPVLRQSYSWWFVPVLFLGYFIGFVLLHLLIVVISVAVVNVDKPPRGESRYYRLLANVTLPMLFKMARVHIHLTGEEKIPENGRYLFVSNHLHEFDPAVIMAVLPQTELGFIGKKEIRQLYPFVAKFMHKLYCLLIDRENNREAIKTILSAVQLLKNDTVSIGLFPEGYCSKDGEVQPMRSGSFKIATKSNVPIVVSTLVGTEKIAKNMFRRRTDVYLDVLECLPVESFINDPTNALGDRVYAIMKENIARRRAQEE